MPTTINDPRSKMSYKDGSTPVPVTDTAKFHSATCASALSLVISALTHISLSNCASRTITAS